MISFLLLLTKYDASSLMDEFCAEMELDVKSSSEDFLTEKEHLSINLFRTGDFDVWIIRKNFFMAIIESF